MMKKARELRSNMAFNIVGAIVALLVLLGLIVSVIGLVSFTEAFRREYAVSTYHMADTATTISAWSFIWLSILIFESGWKPGRTREAWWSSKSFPPNSRYSLPPN